MLSVLQKLNIQGLKILDLPCNTNPTPGTEKSPHTLRPKEDHSDSDEDYLEAEDQPIQQPTRLLKPKRKVRWHGSEEDSSDTDGDPVSHVFVPNSQPDFDAVIHQVNLIDL